jgi:hypothetical protein
MLEYFDLKQLVSAFIGATLALAGQWLVRRAAKAWTAKRLTIAYWEELSAVQFYGPPRHALNFGGFSSQTFDTLFRDLAESLPESLARDIMRYHWRMKYLTDQRKVDGTPNQRFAEAAQELHGRLKERLSQYSRRRIIPLMIRQAETCPERLLIEPQAGAA